MNLSPEQDQALKEVDHWFKNDTGKKKVFRLFGPAGTGKSTLAKHFAQNVSGTVKFGAFTGKAAHVMAKKGCEGASTLHKLIYRPKMASKTHLRKLEVSLADLKFQPEPDFDKIHAVEQEIKKAQQSAGTMNFSLNMESDLRYASLLIVDEVSMVGDSMGKDLESFGVPILVLGDPEQLPPIYGAGYFTDREPDIMLKQIHRQALDNPIIAMATAVREGKSLMLGTYGSSRVVGEKLSEDDIMNHDIILTGLRKTKKECDNKCRGILKRSSRLPMQGDKLMCVKNNHDIGILNGQIWEAVSPAVDLGGGVVSLHIKDPETEDEIIVSASEKLLLGQALDRWEHEEDVQEFEYSYAITTHKSQGSQWNNVLLFDQKDSFKQWSQRDRQRWLYTGITRAAERITVMRL